MTTAPDNNATSWQDLADELTPEQVACYEDLERQTGGRASVQLLYFARIDIEGRLANMAYGDVLGPEGAEWVDKWQTRRDHGWCRSVVWRGFSDEKMSVAIDGWQRCDGTIAQQGISPYLADLPTLTGAEARRLAALLVEAADVLDSLQ